MAITSLPTPPSRSDPENFAERADAFMAALPRFADEANALQQDVTQSAEDADNDARAATLSANAAEVGRAAAALSADAAASSQEGAAQKAAESSDSAALARQWATKLNEPVDAGEFSAKHYAQLAAQGMGLPVFPLASIPSTNVGPIFVPTQGPMEWVAARLRYEVSQPAHGQCRFVYVSPTECRLMPHNGDGLIINGKQYRIDPAGVPLSSIGFTANTTYYVYARDNGVGGIALEAQTHATAPHSAHTDGVEIKTGDPTRTLVGMIRTPGGSLFSWEAARKWVASWFNRKAAAVVESPTNSDTVSTTPVRLTNGLYVLMWAGEVARVRACGVVLTLSAGSQGAYPSLYANGAMFTGGIGYSLTSSGLQVPSITVGPYTANADGAVDFALFGRIDITSVGTRFRHDLSAEVEI